jgi:hypothetical protein
MNEPTAVTQMQLSPTLTAKQAETVHLAWEGATVGVVSALLQTKGVPAYKTATRRGTVFVPMYDRAGDVANLQRLTLRTDEGSAPQLNQTFLIKDAEINGLRHVFGQPTDQEPILFVPDYLSGASLHHSTGHPVVVAFGTDNQTALLDEYRVSFPQSELLICSDTSNEPSPWPVVAPSAIEGFTGANFNDLQLQLGSKAVKFAVDLAIQRQLEIKQENAMLKTAWSGEWQMQADGLKAVRAIVSSTGNPPAFTGGSQESIRGVEILPIWDKETFPSADLARKRATALANKVLESDPLFDNGAFIAPTRESDNNPKQQQSAIEGTESRATKSSEVDEALARLKLQYLLANDKYYLRDESKTLAFEDTGKRLVTAHDASEIARSMVELSKAKGWSAIKITGTDSFKRKVWVEAELLGVNTHGYKPDAFDQDTLQKRRLSQAADTADAPINSISPTTASVKVDLSQDGQAATPQTNAENASQSTISQSSDLAQRYGTRLAKDVSQALADSGISAGSPGASASLAYIAELATSPRAFVGKLLEHGPAPYEFNEKATDSYYAKLLTAAGEKVVWGVDIPRAISESIGERVQAGDQILLAFRGSQPVTVKDELTGKEISTHRNTWYTEKVSQLPSVAAKAEQKPSYNTYLSDKPTTVVGATTAHEKVLIDVLKSKGAPEGAIAAIRSSLATAVPLMQINKPLSTTPLVKPSL